MDTIDDKCDICYRIACKRCGWVASDEEALLIQNGEITECPRCGWSPGND